MELIVGLGTTTTTANVAKIAMEQRTMTRETLDPAVISEELLIAGVEEPVKPEGETWDAIEFPKVTSLKLSFLNIIQVSNLLSFDALTTLRLDNNIIDKIENLGHLKSLTWLDLSFNNIHEIEGLDDLSNLEDLSLYHNKISEIKNLTGCPKLNVLSLGHNNIRDLKQIDYLRKFKNLRCVCLDGNKVCEKEAYSQHVLAFLRNIQYLDYKLIDRKAAATAQEAYNPEELAEIKTLEEQEETRQKALAEKAAKVAQLKVAFLDVTEDLFEQCFSKEVEPEQVRDLNWYPTGKEDYKERLAEDVISVRKDMEDTNAIRLKKVATFEKAVVAAEKESEEEAFEAIRQFKSVKKRVLAALQNDEREQVETVTAQLLEQLEALKQQLMANELQLQESIDDAINDFEVTMQQIMGTMSDRGELFFRNWEDYVANTFHKLLLESANTEMDQFLAAGHQDYSEADDSKVKHLSNRKEMLGAITSLIDSHSALLQAKEEEMANEMKKWQADFFGKHRDAQYDRNRQRVMDVIEIIEACREEIIEAGSADAEDEEDGDVGDQYVR